MIELKDSRQQLRFTLEYLQAIQPVALMADENRSWNTEVDVIWFIALAIEPIVKDVEEIIIKLDKVLGTINMISEDNYVQQG